MLEYINALNWLVCIAILSEKEIRFHPASMRYVEEHVNSCLVLVQTWKTGPGIAEKLIAGT